jgi:hypothetical protein
MQSEFHRIRRAPPFVFEDVKRLDAIAGGMKRCLATSADAYIRVPA